jgi:Ca2+:H+ antiporter
MTEHQIAAAGRGTGPLGRADLLLTAGSAVSALLAIVGRGAGTVPAFVLAALALAVLAGLVGRCVDRLSDRLGPGAVGALQSGLGNLPELFVCVFALRRGLTGVVSAALIGSILGNMLLVLGLSFVVGGRRHGVLRFSELRARMMMSLLLLAVAAMFVPSLAHYVNAAAGAHEIALSRVTAVVLLGVFALSVPSSLRREELRAEDEQQAPYERESPEPDEAGSGPGRPLPLTLALLAAGAALAAYVSDLFVDALQPAMTALHVNEVFAGLVIVAIAGNAVENAVGVRLAWREKTDHALSVILGSPLQIAVLLAPALVLLSPAIGGPAFTLVFSPMLMASVAVSVGVVAFLISDGVSDWLEGATMIGLYILIAAAFWWG